MNFIFKKMFIGTILGFMLFLSITVPVQAEAAQPNYEILKEQSMSATQILEQLFKSALEQTEEEVRRESVKLGYDVDLTIENFRQQGNPFKNYDIEGILAAYATIQGKSSVSLGLQDVPFITATLKERKMKEYKPLKVERFSAVDETLYQKDGYTYISYPAERACYTPLDNGYYQKTGTKKVIPESITTYYAEISFHIISPEELFDFFRVPFSSQNKKEYNRRKQNILYALHHQSLYQNIFVLAPNNDLISENMKIFLSKTRETLTDTKLLLLDTALSLIGKVPYEWGGKPSFPHFDSSWYSFTSTGSQKGLDCSGYVQWVYLTAGYAKTDYQKLLSTSSMLQNLAPISYDELEIGDIGILNAGIGTTNHCGIYLGNDMWIHCSSKYNTVTISENYPFTIFLKAPETRKN